MRLPLSELSFTLSLKPLWYEEIHHHAGPAIYRITKRQGFITFTAGTARAAGRGRCGCGWTAGAVVEKGLAFLPARPGETDTFRYRGWG